MGFSGPVVRAWRKLQEYDWSIWPLFRDNVAHTSRIRYCRGLKSASAVPRLVCCSDERESSKTFANWFHHQLYFLSNHICPSFSIHPRPKDRVFCSLVLSVCFCVKKKGNQVLISCLHPGFPPLPRDPNLFILPHTLTINSLYPNLSLFPTF